MKWELVTDPIVDPVPKVKKPTAADFVFSPFGEGSILEQAVVFVVKAHIGQFMGLSYMSTASKMLNEILERVCPMHNIDYPFEDSQGRQTKFLFETQHDKDWGTNRVTGGVMRIREYPTGRIVMEWRI